MRAQAFSNLGGRDLGLLKYVSNVENFIGKLSSFVSSQLGTIYFWNVCRS